jgi:hypothetical protein
MVEDTTIDEDKIKADEILNSKLGEPLIKDNDEPVPTQEDIEKPIGHKEWHIIAEYNGLRGEKQIFDRTYIQKPLSYLAFGEFTGLLGRSLAEAMKGPDGLSLDRITPGGASIPLRFKDGSVSIADNEADVIDPIIQGIATLASYVPDFMAECQCIWLRVPRQERYNLINIWSLPVDEGGMSMDEGEEMLNIFIEQNYEELNNFLKRYARVKGTVQKMRKRLQKGD